MKKMFDSGEAPPRVALEPLLQFNHLYAIGPLAGLRGEILVWDGTPFVARIDDERVRVAVERDAKAPFLVWSSVKTWEEVAVPEEARTLAGLEAWLPDAARAARIDPSQPFAFLVIGAVEHASAHIVDLPPGMPLTHATHDATQHQVELDHAPVQMLGFFAGDDDSAAGVWTHHSTKVHLHLRNQLGTVVGHVDDFTLSEGAVVRIALR